MFKKFIIKGNMVDMAIGIIIGAAFSTLVKSLVEDIIMPPIGLLIGGVDFSGLFFVLTDPTADFKTVSQAKEAGETVISYGIFINNFITFLIVSYCVFLLVRVISKLKAQEKPDVKTKSCKYCKSTINIAATKCQFCTSKV